MNPQIDLSDDNFGCVLNCAVRYALGRRTYMPTIVVEFITPLLPHVNNRTIWCFRADLESCRDYGDPDIDEPLWRAFQAAVEAEDEKRKANKAE